MLLSHSHDTSYLLFAAHAPCNDSPSAVKDAFWSSLGSVVGGARNRQLLVHVMFCIDADAKIGQVGNSAIGPLSPSDETYNGTRFRVFLTTQGLVAVNTFVCGQPTWRGTFAHEPRIGYICMSLWYGCPVLFFGVWEVRDTWWLPS